jgi:chemotaxis protein CheC
MASAMSSLSQMVGRDVGVASFALRQMPVAEICQMMGGPETVSVGIYVTVSGSADGHILLMCEPKTACGLVDMMMQIPAGTTRALGEMEQSALGELGNVVGSSFLNVLADSTGLKIRPSPPTVMVDMAGALLDAVAAPILMTQDDASVVVASLERREKVATSRGARVSDATGIASVMLILHVADLARAVMQAMPGVAEVDTVSPVRAATHEDRSAAGQRTGRPTRRAA